VSEFLYKLGLRLAQIGFIRSAIDARADLRAFKKRPTLRILAGVFAIGFSFVMCWPAIGVLSGISLYLRAPLLIVIGGPVLYCLSHVCYLTGMALSGAEYSWIFLRWLVRICVESLLNFCPSPERPES
jgi:hypothetical protein